MEQKRRNHAEYMILRRYIEEIKAIPRLSFREECRMLDELRQGKMSHLNKLVTSSLYLVLQEVVQYVDANLPLLDLIQEGTLGLIEAAKKYRYSSEEGVSFKAYARSCIYWTIRNSLDTLMNEIRIPLHRMDSVLKIRDFVQQYRQWYYATPSLSEIAQGTNLSMEEIKEAIKLPLVPISLDSDTSNGGYSIDPNLYEYINREGAISGWLDQERSCIKALFADIGKRSSLVHGDTHILERRTKDRMSTKQAIERVLLEARRALKTSEIIQRVQTMQDAPVNTIHTILNIETGKLVVRVGTSEWDLKERVSKGKTDLEAQVDQILSQLADNQTLSEHRKDKVGRVQDQSEVDDFLKHLLK